MDFSTNLKKARTNAGLTAREFAEKLGIPFATLAGYENKGREPRFELLVKMANLLDVSVDDLLEHKKPIVTDWNDIRRIISDCGYIVEEIHDEYGDSVIVISKPSPSKNKRQEKQVFNKERISLYITDKREQFRIDTHPLFISLMKEVLDRWFIESQQSK